MLRVVTIPKKNPNIVLKHVSIKKVLENAAETETIQRHDKASIKGFILEKGSEILEGHISY